MSSKGPLGGYSGDRPIRSLLEPLYGEIERETFFDVRRLTSKNILVFPYLPERPPGRRVAEAPGSRVLLPEDDGQHCCGPRAKGVPHADDVKVVGVPLAVAGEGLGQEVLVLQLAVDVRGGVDHALHRYSHKRFSKNFLNVGVFIIAIAIYG